MGRWGAGARGRPGEGAVNGTQNRLLMRQKPRPAIIRARRAWSARGPWPWSGRPYPVWTASEGRGRRFGAHLPLLLALRVNSDAPGAEGLERADSMGSVDLPIKGFLDRANVGADGWDDR